MSTAALKDLNKLSTFVRVAERRSFTKAAADLRTTPSVVSNRIKELEDSLGFRLMNRSTHGIVLTEAGEGLLRNCLEMLARIDAFVVEARNVHSGPIGTLRVQSTSDYSRWVLAPLITEFSMRYPGLRVHLSVLEESCSSAEDGVDVIVASRKPSAPGLAGQALGAIPFVICGAPEYLERFGRPKDPQDLREHECLANLFAGAEWPFNVGSRSVPVEVKGSLSSNSYAVLVDMALRGCGIVRVPRHAVAAELASGQLETIFDETAASPEPVSVYYSKETNLPAKTTEFIQFLRSSLGTFETEPSGSDAESLEAYSNDMGTRG